MSKLVNLILVVSLLLAIGGAAGASTLLFSDNFSSGNLSTPTYSPNGATWNYIDSSWQIQSQKLVTGPWGDDPISVIFGATTSGTPVEVDFELQQYDQSASSTLFDFGLSNSVTGQSYIEKASTLL